jgi:putative ABC transport system substrate-binding protein
VKRLTVALLVLALLAAPHGTQAQPAAKVPKVGYLAPHSASPVASRDAAFRRGLSELGYVEGKNIVIEYRFADEKFERLPSLAAELVQLKVDVIVAAVTQASLAAKNVTKTIPVVMVGVGDPVGAGLVASLGRPGGNVTGTSGMAPELVGKSLETLTEAVPHVSRVAVLWNPANQVFQVQMLRETKAAGQALGMPLQILETRVPNEFDRAFAAMTRERAGALLVLTDPMFLRHRALIADLALKSRLPVMYGGGGREYPEAGGLLAYGPNYPELFRRAATYVDKILKGAKPADLPVEQPTKFELVINLKTAKALGLTIPQSILLKADEVIQ